MKPGAGTDILINSANNDLNLSKSDVLIFCGGANSIGRNNSTTALKHIMDFIKTNNHTNIILLTVLPWYDLMQSLCVNNEIKSFIRKLKKMVKVYQHTSVLDMDDRKLFTNHSLHLNSQGKEALSKLIVSYTYSILEEKMDPPIILNSKTDQNQTVPLNQEKVINRTSTRPRKTPLKKYDDFFMVNTDHSVGDNSLINGSVKVM